MKLLQQQYTVQYNPPQSLLTLGDLVGIDLAVSQVVHKLQMLQQQQQDLMYTGLGVFSVQSYARPGPSVSASPPQSYLA